ncbi:MAG: hypothetical protein HY608_02555 [Planctomycetes bacterium]|nr:hypothetical protein [Planctomycetota bacterium]
MRVMQGDWRDLFSVFRIALDPRKLALAMVGLTLTVVVCGALVGLFVWIDDRWGAETDAPALVPSVRAHLGATDEIERGRHLVAARARLSEYFDTTFHRSVARGISRKSLLAAHVRNVAERTVGAGRVRGWVESLTPQRAQGWLLWIACLAAGWYIWSMFGGAITRIAAVEIAKDERIEFAEAWTYARTNWRSYFWSPTIVALGMTMFALCNFAGGYWCGHHHALAPWILGVGLGVVVLAFLAKAALGGGASARGAALGALAVVALAAVSWPQRYVGEAVFLFPGLPLALLSGLLILLLGIGVALGWPLMLPAISAEGTDSFDAIARSFSYLYGHPWRYLWYHIVGALYAIPCVLFVLAAACALTHVALCTGGMGMDLCTDDAQARYAPVHDTISYVFAGLGIGHSGDLPDGRLARAVGYCASIVLLVLWGLSVAYIPAFILTAHTVMYFLLRKVTDGTEMKEVFEEEPEEEWAPPPPPEAAGAAPSKEGKA